LIITMHGGEKLSLDKIRELMSASEDLRFTGHARADIYEWVETTLREHGYEKQGREVKGLLRSYIAKMTGKSGAVHSNCLPIVPCRFGSMIPSNRRRYRWPSMAANWCCHGLNFDRGLDSSHSVALANLEVADKVRVALLSISLLFASVGGAGVGILGFLSPAHGASA